MARFITFEGIEGCGKTTQIHRLSRRLQTCGIPLIATREPGGCPIADQIRSILLNADNCDMVPMTELLLYAAARAQHVAEVIAPALAGGKNVLCDRFTDATIAYQGYGRHLELPVLEQLNSLATGGVTPDLTILMDCPVEIGLKRATARNSAALGEREERFELESLQFHQRVRDAYLLQARREPARFLVVDASRSMEETEEQIASEVLGRLQASR